MSPQGNGSGKRLNGWKEIGQCIGKTARTAQRWEVEFGLPVHRIHRNNHEVVIAYEEEINEWQVSSERLRFEVLLADISARLINLPPNQVDTVIQGALEMVCSSLSIDHFSFWQHSPVEPDHLTLTHIFRNPEMSPIPVKINGSEACPYSRNKILANEIVYVPDTSHPPEEVDAVTLETWRRSGLRSLMAFPLSVGGGKRIGSIGIGCIRPREWSDTMRNRFQLLAGVFANALARKFADQKLRENELRLNLTAESAQVGHFTLDPVDGKMWASEIALKHVGLVPGEELNLEKVLSRVLPQDRTIIEEGIQQAMQSGKETTVTFRFQYPDGSLHQMMSRGCRHSYSQNAPQLIMGVILQVE